MKKFETQLKLIFSISGEGFSSGDIFNLLKVKPSCFWEKGDNIPIPKGLVVKEEHTRIRKETVWEFSTGFIETLDVEDVYHAFFSKIDYDKLEAIKLFVSRRNLDVSLDLVVEIVDEMSPSIYVSNDMINFCRELQIEMDIDIYVLSNPQTLI